MTNKMHCKEKTVACYSRSTRIKPLAAVLAHCQQAQRTIQNEKKKKKTENILCFGFSHLQIVKIHTKKKNSNDSTSSSSHILKSISIANLRFLFFVISSDLLMLDYMFFPAKKFIYILVSALLLQSISSDLSERLSPG